MIQPVDLHCDESLRRDADRDASGDHFPLFLRSIRMHESERIADTGIKTEDVRIQQKLRADGGLPRVAEDQEGVFPCDAEQVIQRGGVGFQRLAWQPETDAGGIENLTRQVSVNLAGEEGVAGRIGGGEMMRPPDLAYASATRKSWSSARWGQIWL